MSVWLSPALYQRISLVLLPKKLPTPSTCQPGPGSVPPTPGCSPRLTLAEHWSFSNCHSLKSPVLTLYQRTSSVPLPVKSPTPTTFSSGPGKEPGLRLALQWPPASSQSSVLVSLVSGVPCTVTFSGVEPARITPTDSPACSPSIFARVTQPVGPLNSSHAKLPLVSSTTWTSEFKESEPSLSEETSGARSIASPLAWLKLVISLWIPVSAL